MNADNTDNMVRCEACKGRGICYDKFGDSCGCDECKGSGTTRSLDDQHWDDEPEEGGPK